MLQRIGSQLVAAVGILLAVSALVFLGTEALPGDAATAVLGQYATPDLLERMREEHGLDRPVLLRYVEWLAGFVEGDFGRSMVSGWQVSEVIGGKIRNSLALMGVTLVLLVPLAIGLAIAAVLRRDRPVDIGIATGTLVLIATPEFVVGSVLAVVFGVWLAVLPPVSLLDTSRPVLNQFDLLLLPAFTLLGASVAQTTRMVRACLIDVLEAPFIQMAKLKGVRPSRIMLAHALPNAIGPTIQILVFNIAWLAGGVVVVENVFQFPGLGMELVKSVTTRDLPLVTSLAMIITSAYVVTNLLGEILMILLNPRSRRSAR